MNALIADLIAGNEIVATEIDAGVSDAKGVITECVRGRFGEIVRIAVDGKPVAISDILKRYKAALPEEYVNFDRKGRGDSLNLDLYGFDPVQNVAVVQARHAFRRRANDYLATHKTYFLTGLNEITGTAFRHPVSSGSIRAAARKGDAVEVVRAAQRWMWQVTPKQLEAGLAAGLRQGDVLLVLERGEPEKHGAIEELGREHVLAGSHLIRASRIVRIVDMDGIKNVWALSPTMYHTKAQHDPVCADLDGWHSVRVAEEEAAWNFAQRLGD